MAYALCLPNQTQCDLFIELINGDVRISAVFHSNIRDLCKILSVAYYMPIRSTYNEVLSKCKIISHEKDIFNDQYSYTLQCLTAWIVVSKKEKKNRLS